MIRPKLIVANGCSMASGFECTEPGKQLPQDWEHSWPKQLCDILGCDGANMSRAGQSNWSIAVNTQSILLREFKNRNPQDMLVVIGWTEFTRAEFVNIVEPVLREVKGRRGITDFRVVCDETNNTPAIVDRNEFIANIFIKPARSINYVTLNFVAVRTGVDFEEVVGTV